MSTFGKIIVSLIIIGILIFGVWFFTHTKTTYVAPVTTNTVQPVSPQTPPDNTGGIATRDSSDASLDADLSSIDANMSLIDANSAAADKSFNDKPVTQSE